MKRKAFTLAEVLITLGVIGIVAALTMPALVANYQKKVLVTRMQKINAIWATAGSVLEAEGLGQDRSMLTTNYSLDEIEEWWNVNFAEQIKTVNTKKLSRGLTVAFPDGSGAFFYNYAPSAGMTVYHIWCVNAKDCMDMDDSSLSTLGNGKTIFPGGLTGRAYRSASDEGGVITREYLVENCAANPSTRDSNCAALIKYDGWEIKDDYPWF